MKEMPCGSTIFPVIEMCDYIYLIPQCARDGDEHMMSMLLRNMGSQAKKRINQLDEDDLSALHYAARCNFMGVVKLLVENGAGILLRRMPIVSV